jgi:hypothetical protein
MVEHERQRFSLGGVVSGRADIDEASCRLRRETSAKSETGYTQPQKPKSEGQDLRGCPIAFDPALYEGGGVEEPQTFAGQAAWPICQDIAGGLLKL